MHLAAQAYLTPTSNIGLELRRNFISKNSMLIWIFQDLESIRSKPRKPLLSNFFLDKTCSAASPCSCDFGTATMVQEQVDSHLKNKVAYFGMDSNLVADPRWEMHGWCSFCPSIENLLIAISRTYAVSLAAPNSGCPSSMFTPCDHCLRQKWIA